MKKRFILLNIAVLIVSLLAFLMVSAEVVSHTNQRNMENEIRNYLSVIEEEYDGTNMQEVADRFHSADGNLRITFISEDGTVIYDTSEISEENHLERPEIQNLGTVTHRYSSTTGIKMFYVACHVTPVSSNPVFIRVSMPETSISDMTNTLIWTGVGTIVLISVLSALLIVFLSNRAVEPLRKEVSKFSEIVGDVPSYEGSDIEKLSSQIDQAGALIRNKMDSIEYEQKKTEYLIETIRQGIVILDGEGTIVLANQKASDIFGKKKEDMLGKYYIYSFLHKEISDAIDECRKADATRDVEYASGERNYVISITSLKASFLRKDEDYGVSMLIYDVTESKRLEKTKTDFFANASHELKSPLTTIIGYQQMIEQGILTDPEEISDATRKTVKEASRMNQIITEMLELSKLESNPPEEKKNLSLARACDEILASYDSLLKKKNIRITRIYSDFSANISGDDLYHLLRNLIDNAVKYNHDNGEIILKISAERQELSIQDTGIGIARENLSRIFERFYRVDKAKSKENGGTGLGLAIVKHICMNNSLEITVNSDLGKGTEFTVKF